MTAAGSFRVRPVLLVWMELVAQWYDSVTRESIVVHSSPEGTAVEAETLADDNGPERLDRTSNGPRQEHKGREERMKPPPLRSTRTGRMALVTTLSMLLAGTVSSGVAGQGAGEVSLAVEVRAANQEPMELTCWLGPERLRMDTSPLSMVWRSGASPRMVVIQHPARQYIEFTSEDLETMRRMMEEVRGGGGDVSRLGFEVTGRRETIGAWHAFEVRVTGLPQGQEGSLWLTNEMEAGLFEVFARLSDVMGGIPMPTGDGAAPQELLRYAGLAEAPGVPDGKAVRYVATEGGTTTTVTVVALQPGPFPDDTFGAPPGYKKFRIPSDEPDIDLLPSPPLGRGTSEGRVLMPRHGLW